MKAPQTKYKVHHSAGRFHVSQRKPGENYFTATGKSFFSRSVAEDWIKLQQFEETRNP